MRSITLAPGGLNFFTTHSLRSISYWSAGKKRCSIARLRFWGGHFFDHNANSIVQSKYVCDQKFKKQFFMVLKPSATVLCDEALMYEVLKADKLFMWCIWCHLGRVGWAQIDVHSGHIGTPLEEGLARFRGRVGLRPFHHKR